MNTNHEKKKGFKLPVPRLRGNGLLKQLCFAAALAFGTAVSVPASAGSPQYPSFTNYTASSSGGTIAVGDSMKKHSFDGTSFHAIAIIMYGQPAHGTVTYNGTPISNVYSTYVPMANVSSIIYTPNSGYSGADALDWKIGDDDGGSSYTATGTFAITSAPAPLGTTLSASGDVTYTASAIAIAPALTVVSGSNITGASISIDSNFVSAQDRLTFTASTNISGSYNSSLGILTLTGTAGDAEYQTVLRSIQYSNISSNPTRAKRKISISLGGGAYNKDNGHFYEVVNGGNLSWASAKTAAQARTMMGLHGYLVTVTTSAENTFLTQKVNTDSWMGGSDAASEGVWRWVTGPEGTEAGGAGRQFSTQNIGSTGASYGGQFVNWNNNEPNNSGGNENWGEVLGSGKWNDLPASSTLPAYIVEYGGMSTDPSVQITGAVGVNVDPPFVVSSVTPSLSPIAEDFAGGSGVLVSSFAAATGTSATVGIAVTSMSGAGQWQRSTDGGSTWWGVDYGSPATAALSETNAVLLTPSTKIRFVPNANFNGNVSLTYHAWDQSTGSSNAFVAVSTNGSGTAYTSNTGTLSLAVTAVNDAPNVLTPGSTNVLNFGGGGDYANTGDLSLSGATTVEAWIYMDNVNKNWSRVIDMGNGPGSNTIEFGFSGTTGKMFAEVYNGTTSLGPVSTPNVAPTAQWMHVAAVYNGGQVSIYWNGILQVTGACKTPANVARSRNYIGKSNWADEYFAGKMSELKIWKTARSASEIIADMRGTLTGSESGLAAYYKCNDGSSTSLINYKTGGSPATLVGASWLRVSGPAGSMSGITGTTLPVIGLSVDDIDAGTAVVSVKLGVDHGKIDLSSTVVGGLSSSEITGSGTDSVSITSTIAKINATLADTSGLSYTSTSGYTGADRMYVRMNDLGNTGSGGALSDVKSIAIQVIPNPNQAPVVRGFSVTVNENQTVVATSGGSATTFTDADGDAPTAAKIVTLPAHGLLSVSGTAVNAGDVLPIASFQAMIYTPTTGYHGADSFTFNATDGTVYADTAARVDIMVVNQAPVLANQNYSTTENADLLMSTPLAASTDFYIDAENDQLTKIMITALPSNGTLLLSGQPVTAMQEIQRNDIGYLVYRPNFLFSGNDQFSMNAFDGLQYASAPTNINVAVAHVDFAPTDLSLSANTVEENQPSGTLIGTISATVVDTNTSLSYTLVSGAGDDNNGSFAILAGNQLIATDAFNYEVQSSLTVRLRVEDANGTSYEKAFPITVLNIVEGATDIVMTGQYFEENSPIGTLAGSFATIDDESTASFIYGFASGAGDDDNSMFTIDNNQLLTNVVGDFETKPEYSIRVISKDNNGNQIEKQFSIRVTDANDAPTSITLSNTAILDNQPTGSAVGNLSTTDQDVNDTQTYTLVNGAGSQDNSFFSISGGQLVTASVLNANSQSSYAVRVRSTDAAGSFTEKEFTITATHANQGITGITLSNASIAENQLPGAIVGTLASVSQDQGETYTYAFVQGSGSTGNSKFAINGNVLSAAVTFDYESQNAYTIRVRSTNSTGQHFDRIIPIIIRNVNDAPTAVSVTFTNTAENLPTGTAIGIFNTDDQDQGDAHTFTLVHGAGDIDNAHFSVNLNKLVATTSFDYESQSSYSIRVRSTDGAGATTEAQVTVQVTDVNETPTALANTANTIAENLPVGTVLTQLSSTDEDRGDTHAYSLVNGAGDDDNSSFAIVNNELVSNQMFNYEAKSTYSVRLQTMDAGGLTFEKQLTIHIADVNDAPVASAMHCSMKANSVLGLYARNFKASTTDDEGTALQAIRITYLPQNGSLTLDGNAVALGSVIPTARLNGLAYTPNHNFAGVDNFDWVAYDGTDFSTTSATATIDVQTGSIISGTYGPLSRPTSIQAGVLNNSMLTTAGNQRLGDVTSIDNQEVESMIVSNYPNPFATSATIKYELPADMHVSVKIYDMSGKEINNLVNAEQSAGTYTQEWNGKGTSMDAASEGQYLYVLTATDAAGKVTVKTGKMVKVK